MRLNPAVFNVQTPNIYIKSANVPMYILRAVGNVNHVYTKWSSGKPVTEVRYTNLLEAIQAVCSINANTDVIDPPFMFTDETGSVTSGINMCSGIFNPELKEWVEKDAVMDIEGT